MTSSPVPPPITAPRGRFWPAAWAACALVVLLAASVIGLRLAVKPMYEEASREAFTVLQWYLIAGAGAATSGAALGGMAWLLFAPLVPAPRLEALFAVALAFAFASIIAAAGAFISFVALMGSALLPCFAGLGLFALASTGTFCIPPVMRKLYVRLP